MNKTPTLFVTGLVIGALTVFLIRAVTGGAASESDAPTPPSQAGPAHAHEGAGAAPPDAVDPGAPDHAAMGHDVPVEPEADAVQPAKKGILELRLTKEGEVALARMRMPDGSAHPVRAGKHAPMGDYRTVILGRKGRLAGHLHAHEDGRLELTVTGADGERVARRVFTPAENRPPENELCPVMGNEVDPDVYVDYRGRRVGFCCPGCDEMFLEDPERYLKKVDKEIAARKGDK